jgi:hypothetical protein
MTHGLMPSAVPMIVIVTVMNAQMAGSNSALYQLLA